MEVSAPAVVRSALGSSFNESVSLPSCVHEAFSTYSDHLKEATMQEAKKRLNVDAVFIMHYPRLLDRRRKLENMLAAQGLAGTVTWVEWDGLFAQLSAPSLCCVFDCASGWWQRAVNGTKDLSLRHLYAYYQTYRLGLERVLVFEDDVALEGQANLSAVVRDIVRWAPRDLTSVMIGGTRDWHACNTSRSSTDVGDYKLVGPGYGARGGEGYLLTQAGARRLLSNIFTKGNGVNYPADTILDSAVNAGGYWLEPPLVTQTRGGGSGDPRTDSRHPERLPSGAGMAHM